METEQIQIVLPPALRSSGRVPPRRFGTPGSADSGPFVGVADGDCDLLFFFFLNILSLRRSGEQAALAEQPYKPAVAPLGRTLLGWRMGKPGLSVAEALNYS